jgi:hypothetical protein
MNSGELREFLETFFPDILKLCQGIFYIDTVAKVLKRIKHGEFVIINTAERG